MKTSSYSLSDEFIVHSELISFSDDMKGSFFNFGMIAVYEFGCHRISLFDKCILISFIDDMKGFFLNFRAIARSTNSVVFLRCDFHFLFSATLLCSLQIIFREHFEISEISISFISFTPEVDDNALLLWRAIFFKSYFFEKLL